MTRSTMPGSLSSTCISERTSLYASTVFCGAISTVLGIRPHNIFSILRAYDSAVSRILRAPMLVCIASPAVSGETGPRRSAATPPACAARRWASDTPRSPAAVAASTLCWARSSAAETRSSIFLANAACRSCAVLISARCEPGIKASETPLRRFSSTAS